jgi:hypothetical protein
MRSIVWRTSSGARNSILPPGAGSSVALAAILALVVAGCAPHYRDWDEAAYDAEAPTPRAKRKAKVADKPAVSTTADPKPAKIPVPDRALLAPQAEPKCEDVKAATTGSVQTAKAEPKRTTGTDAVDETAKAALPQGQSSAAAATPPSDLGDTGTSLALRIKLEYERECYRQAELRARGRLDQLQRSVGTTIKAVEAQSR